LPWTNVVAVEIFLERPAIEPPGEEHPAGEIEGGRPRKKGTFRYGRFVLQSGSAASVAARRPG
jgi:hypothetical protein